MQRACGAGMQRVLVAVNLDAQAPTALALARALVGPDTEVRVVHAYSPSAAAIAGAAPSRDACLDLLRKHAGSIPDAQPKQLDGAPARAILEEARAWGADTIVVAPRSRSTVERFLMGSISSDVLRNAEANVLLARPGASAVRRLLVCTDLHEPSRRAALLASRLGGRTGASTTLLFAADPAFWGPDATAPWPPEAYQLDAEWLDRAQQEALHEWLRAKVRAFNDQYLGGRATPVVREGHPKDVLLREAARHDLVVLGTHGPSLYERAAVGSVAEHVAARAPTSVLVVRT